MRAEIDHADHLARIALIQQIAHGKEVAEGFGHLLPLDLQHLVMHPDLREPRLRMGAAALRQFILVMRELQINPAAMNVKGRPQQLIAHGAAFDMPAGPPAPPRAVPARGFGIRRFPQHEIHRVFLEGRHLDPRPCDHVIDRPPREPPVFGIRPHPEQHMPFLGIGMPPRDQRLDHGDHRPDIGRGARLMRRAQRAQGIHVVVIPADRLFRPLGDQLLQRPRRPGLLPCQGGGVDLVIHIGEVAHIGHLPRAIDMAQQPEQRVEHHHRPGIADMGAVIDRGATDIDPHILRIDRDKDVLRPCLRIVQPDRHHVPNPECGTAARMPSPGAGLSTSSVLGNEKKARATEWSAGNAADADGACLAHAQGSTPKAPRRQARSQRNTLARF